MKTSDLLLLSFYSMKKYCLLLLVVFFVFALTACRQGESTVSESDIAASASPNIGDQKQTAEALVERGRKASHFIIGTGSVEGVYFPIAGIICRLLNRHKSDHNVRCSVESTGGSIYNLKELRKGSFDIVVAQSDWQYHAYNGTSAFEKEGANKELRTVFALEADPLALLVRKDSDINDFDDLYQRQVSFGYMRSLQYRIIAPLLEAKGWAKKSFSGLLQMSDNKQVVSLCDGTIDAALFLSSSLEDRLRNLDEGCALKLVPIDSSEVNSVIAQNPYLRKSDINQRHYFSETELSATEGGESKRVSSYGLGATFVTMQSASPKAVYHVTKEIVENFQDFQSLHPSLQTLTLEDLSSAGITAPLHAGAIRYFKEARLLK